MPFVCFLGGYYTISVFFGSSKTVIVPALIGLPVHEALLIASNHYLYLTVIKETNDERQSPGTIIASYPVPGTRVRPNQRVEIVIVKHPEKLEVPDYQNQPLSVITKPYRHYHISYNAPAQVICAQWPLAHSKQNAGEKSELIVYTPMDEPHVYCMPSFKNLPQQEVFDQCALMGLEPIFYFTSLKETFDRRVIDQRPTAGTLFSLKKPPVIHIKLS